MAELIKMPRLSDTMTDGVLVKWHKKIGDHVSEGDLLAEIETDKATMEFESFQEGVLLYIGVQENETVAVDSMLAILGDKNEDITSLINTEKNLESNKVDFKQKNTLDGGRNEDQLRQTDAHVTKSKVVEDKLDSNNRIKISPLAKKIAQENKIDIENLVGTGDGGRIIKRDIKILSSNLESDEVQNQNVPLSQMRRTIANRLAESKFSAPHFYLNIEVEMDELIKNRTIINQNNNLKISFNDILVKGVAMAIKKHPIINSSWEVNSIQFHKNINIGVAVSLTNGLVVPVIKNADHKSCMQISDETNMFIQKARENKLQPEDWSSNTFTISNLGMYGIDDFTAIINQPDACILAVGAIKERAIIKNGEVVSANIMRLTLSCDHRVVDGVEGAKFLSTLKTMLETPLMMLC